jgi:AraC-like DNA-binding protein
MLCISPGENHLVIMENCRYSAVNFEFLPDGGGEALQIPLPELLGVIGGRHLEAPGNYPLFELGEHEAELERLAGQIRASGDTGPAEAAVALQQFLLALARVAFSPEKDAGDFDKAMAEVKKQIERDFAKPLSLDILAKSVFVSRRSLTRRFRAAYGTSPLAYQNERRMQAALMLLRASDLQIQQIAAETGFSDIYQFSKAFKKFAGKTPSGFRE